MAAIENIYFSRRHTQTYADNKDMQPVDIAGATVRSRTADILITSEVLYQLSYDGPKMNRGQYSCFFDGCPLIYRVR